MSHRSSYASATECFIAFRRSELAREAFGLWFRWAKTIIVPGRSIGFALLGESLFPNAEKVTKKSCPCIRVSLRSTSLIPSLLRGSPRKGHPWPFTALAASKPLAPLRSDSIRPSERGVRRRLAGRAMEKQEAVSIQRHIADGREKFVGWKTAKHFPPQSSPRSVSNFAFENRWVSFALPTLRSVRSVRRRLIDCSSVEQSVFLPTFASVQTTRTRSPFRRLNVGAAQGDARHGCRARSDGPGMALRDDPRSSAGEREVLRSKTRMLGWPSFWLLFLGHSRKSDSPSRAKPMPRATPLVGRASRSQKASRASSLLRQQSTFIGDHASQVLPC